MFKKKSNHFRLHHDRTGKLKPFFFQLFLFVEKKKKLIIKMSLTVALHRNYIRKYNFFYKKCRGVLLDFKIKYDINAASINMYNIHTHTEIENGWRTIQIKNAKYLNELVNPNIFDVENISFFFLKKNVYESVDKVCFFFVTLVIKWI